LLVDVDRWNYGLEIEIWDHGAGDRAVYNIQVMRPNQQWYY
jgi:hypothetical protein